MMKKFTCKYYFNRLQALFSHRYNVNHSISNLGRSGHMLPYTSHFDENGSRNKSTSETRRTLTANACTHPTSPAHLPLANADGILAHVLPTSHFHDAFHTLLPTATALRSTRSPPSAAGQPLIASLCCPRSLHNVSSRGRLDRCKHVDCGRRRLWLSGTGGMHFKNRCKCRYATDQWRYRGPRIGDILQAGLASPA
jgi:hypothetical protein